MQDRQKTPQKEEKKPAPRLLGLHWLQPQNSSNSRKSRRGEGAYKKKRRPRKELSLFRMNIFPLPCISQGIFFISASILQESSCWTRSAWTSTLVHRVRAMTKYRYNIARVKRAPAIHRGYAPRILYFLKFPFKICARNNSPVNDQAQNSRNHEKNNKP